VIALPVFLTKEVQLATIAHVTEIIPSSPKSFDDAMAAGVKLANKT